jgi:hypothetical protein
MQNTIHFYDIAYATPQFMLYKPHIKTEILYRCLGQ